MRVAVIGVMLVALSGCVGELGLNFQRSALRSSGDLASTTRLELISVSAVEKEKAEIIKYAKELLEFIETGKVKDLPVDELDVELRKLVPVEFALFVDAAMGYISFVDVDIDGKIGEANVKRINAFLNGVIGGATYYDVKDKKPTDE